MNKTRNFLIVSGNRFHKKRLTNTKKDDKNTLLIILATRVLSYFFTSVVFQEVRIAILLLPPKGTLFRERNEQQRGLAWKVASCM